MNFSFCLFILLLFFNGKGRLELEDGQEDTNCEAIFSLTQVLHGPKRGIYLKFQNESYKEKHAFLDNYHKSSLEYNCSLRDLTQNGSKELIIRWSFETYGSGGGSKDKGIQIWSLKSKERLFKAKTFCMEEGFSSHRYNSPGYEIKCHQEIKINKKYISVSKVKCEKEGEWEGEKPYCTLDNIESGKYKIKSAGLVDANTSSDYVLDNETTIFAFKTKNGKKLVIAKDTSDQYLIYRFGTPDKIELEYPSHKKSSWEKFHFSIHSNKKILLNIGNTSRYLYFKRDHYQYVVYQKYFEKRKTVDNGIKIINQQKKDTTKINADSRSVIGSLLKLRKNDKINIGDKSFD